MKRKNFRKLVGITLLLFAVSCTKENLLKQDSRNTTGFTHNKTVTCSDVDLDSITIVDGMLKFPSVGNFQRVLECLEYQEDAHLDSFETAYASYTVD